MTRLSRWRCARPMTTCEVCGGRKNDEAHEDKPCHLTRNFTGCGAEGNTDCSREGGGTFYRIEECDQCGGEVEYD